MVKVYKPSNLTLSGRTLTRDVTKSQLPGFLHAGFKRGTPPTLTPASSETSSTVPTTNRTPLFNPAGEVKAPFSRAQYEQTYGAQPVDENAIRENILKEQQSRIDAINQVYNSLISSERARQEELARSEAGQSRALRARGGLLGSARGEAQRAEVARFGAEREAKAVGLLEAQRNEQIQAVYNKVDELASKKAEAELQRAQGKAEEYKAYLKTQQDEARSILFGAAQQGITVEDLKKQAPNKLNQLLSNAGLDEFSANVLMASQNPRLNAKYERVGNKMVGYYIDPITGEFVTFTSKEIPGLEEGQKANIQTFDGIPYVLKRDDVGNIIGEVLPGFERPSEKLAYRDVKLNNGRTERRYYDPKDPATVLFAEDMGRTYKGGSGGGRSVGFTPTERKKLEEAGLEDAPREDKLTYLFGTQEEKTQIKEQYRMGGEPSGERKNVPDAEEIVRFIDEQVGLGTTETVIRNKLMTRFDLDFDTATRIIKVNLHYPR